MSDWWSRRLADTSPRPAPRQETAPPVTPPTRFGVHVPVQAPAAAPQVHSGNQRLLDETRSPTDQISMGDALRLWKGGEATRREGNATCPSCGSRNVFSRSKGSMVNGATPAPRCFECGWNGIYEQGEQGNWVT